MAKVLLIEYCNFIDYPVGGQFTFARQMIGAFGNQLALVGITTDDSPVGHWIKREIDGITFDVFYYHRVKRTAKKPLVPARISNYLYLSFFRRAILECGIKNIFIQAPEALIAIANNHPYNICYKFPGVENPLSRPRYAWGKLLAHWFDTAFFRAFKQVRLVLAAADDRAITGLIERSKGRLTGDKVVSFPERVDTTIFKPVSPLSSRRILDIRHDGPIIISCGRLNATKGWRLIIDAFLILLESIPKATLIFVGDGEDRNEIEQTIKLNSLEKNVMVTGFQSPPTVSTYLNAADAVVVGSLTEGWSMAMLEALACGKPIVTTDVSGARAMVVNGINGFIVQTRDPADMAEAIAKTLLLEHAFETSLNLSKEFALNKLPHDLISLWPVMEASPAG